MPSLTFHSLAPVLSRPRRLRSCRVLACSTRPESSQEESSSNDNGKSVDNSAKDGWALWNAALRADAEASSKAQELRDPRRETDFWRSAAREIGADAPESPVEAPSTSENLDEAQPTKLWGLARGVTGSMAEMEQQLREEIEQFDPRASVDDYRDIAREIVGPANDDLDDSAKLPSEPRVGPVEDAEAEAGSAWNPEVDWMRFDDVARDARNKESKAAREHAAEDAERKKRDALQKMNEFEYSPTPQMEFTYADGDGRTLSDEQVRQALEEGAVVLDEAGNEVTLEGKRVDVPYDNRDNTLHRSDPRGESTYGGGWSGAEEAANELEKRGVPLRDPKAERDFWRDAAREVAPVVSGEEQNVDVEEGNISSAKENVVKEDKTPPEDVESGAAWSLWSSASARWQSANEDPKPRDPQAEVDMWRSTARELDSPTDNGSEATSASGLGNDENKSVVNDESSAWDSWNAANSKWAASFSDPELAKDSAKFTGGFDPNKSQDWGAGLGGVATSDRAAWQNWQNAGAPSVGSDQSLWWDSRAPSADGTRGRRKGGDTDLWREAARQVYSEDEQTPSVNSQNTEGAVPRSQTGKGVAVEFWTAAAREIAPPEPRAENAEEEGNGDPENNKGIPLPTTEPQEDEQADK